MPQTLVAGNWPLPGLRARAPDLIGAIRQGLGTMTGVMVAVCPPFVYLTEAARLLQGSPLALGAQDLCERTGEGAFTGEVSGAMLRDAG